MRIQVYILLSVFWAVSSCFNCAYGLNTSEVDTVRRKDVLSEADIDVIDRFVAGAISELTDSENFADVAATRIAFVSRGRSSSETASEQYESEFNRATAKYMGLVLDQIGTIEDKDRREKVVVNLLIVAENLGSLQISVNAVDFLEHPSSAVRYWAVKCFTDEDVISALNEPGADNAQIVRQIGQSLGKIIEGGASAEFVAMASGLAARLETGDMRDLLNLIADSRIERYRNWDVDYSPADAVILRNLADKIEVTADSQSRAALARRFGQLYSFVIQRYIKGQGTLTEDQKNNLLSVMAEVERFAVSDLLEGWPGSIKKALEADSISALRDSHDELLGSEGEAGMLAEEYGFEYDNAGQGSTAPAVLPDRGAD